MTLRHILARRLAAKSLKEHYWAVRDVWGRLTNLRGESCRDFRRLVIDDQFRFMTNGVQPISGESRERAELAVRWLLQAQKASPDNGVSSGYFSNGDNRMAWSASYPETTGYIIQSLFDYSMQYDDVECRVRALEMAEWESRVQMASGAVQGGPLCSVQQQVPAVFNTGMVLQGYSTVLTQISDEAIYNSAHRAARFLVDDLGSDGHFKTHGTFVTAAKIKTYNVLCAWALYRFGERSGNREYTKAAVRSVEAAIGQQHENGWFANNDLGNPDIPLTHTIGYTLQGILEVGVLSGREDMLASVRRGFDPIIKNISPKGFLAGRFFSDWQPASLSSCLTGSAQLAIIALRLYEVTGDEVYREAGNRLLNYLKYLQPTNNPDPNVVGALAGSFPMFLGSYMSAGYPNWATKYLLDALMLQDRLST
jgi:hypothetical protein